MSTSTSPKQSEDLISNVMRILPDKILQLLPIRDAARASVLSKQWQCHWLSLKRLDFGLEFNSDVTADWEECINIISNILFLHNGPVHEFSLYIPESKKVEDKCMYLGPWLSFLSKNEVRRIEIDNDIPFIPMPSHIFWFSELIHLKLQNFTLHPPPSGFSGFRKLQYLELCDTAFSQEDILPRLMANCRKLASLTLWDCSGMGHIVIDIPTLETFNISSFSECESIAFRDVSNLKNLELSLENMPTSKTIDSFNSLACLRQLQCIEFGGGFLKGQGNIKRLVRVTFNHLNKLALHSIALSSLDALQNIFDMIESCPFMKKLFISISSSNKAIHQKLERTKIHKSPYLVEVRITGITGANVELQLIEYILTTAVALERLVYNMGIFDTELELKLSRVLLGIPRASSKARLVYKR